ncbi:MAG TPA: nucleotidyl transferase AbiEii/AbiGii toxin family protein [Acidobacteriota bacterium]|nr:nucleotidyl transferase AbiEii/AbiGii toxin family protein [Acidobacteriota bacterium]
MDVDQIRRLTITAMVSDDDLLDKLVLKGGNAICIGHGISTRASTDIDFSVEDDLSQMGLPEFEARVSKNLIEVFYAEGYTVFDIRVREVPLPECMDAATREFWGGYTIEFKLTPKDRFDRLKNDLDALRRDSTVVGPRHQRKFSIQISKHEYCREKIPKRVNGFTVYVYTPGLLLAEKLRAICQQMPEFRDVVRTSLSARARDFFDIWVLVDAFGLDVTESEFHDLVRSVFAAKRVPLLLLGSIRGTREFHRSDFEAVRDTVDPGFDLKDFDFYFNYVVRIADLLKALWIE